MSKLIRRKKEIGAALAVALQLSTLGLTGVIAHFAGGPQQRVKAPAGSHMIATPQAAPAQGAAVTDLSARRASAIRATKLYEPRATQIFNLATSHAEPAKSTRQAAQQSMQQRETPDEATLTIDREDYPPYSYVYINGTGFAPGETVNMIMVELDPIQRSFEPWDVVADENGNIATSWYISSEELIGATMQVTATGQTSGLTASATFTGVANLAFYENSGRTIARDAFAWGSSVYARLSGTNNSRCYRIEWRNPSDTVAQTTDFNPTNGNDDDSFIISASGPSGVWTVNVYEGTTGTPCNFSAPLFSRTFDVARAVIIGAVPSGGVGGDNFVDQQNPTAVQGSGGTGQVLSVNSESSNQNHRSFVRFDLTGAGISGTVNSATLRMLLSSAQNGFPRTHTANRVTSTWLQSTITWNNQPTFSAPTDSQTAPSTIPAFVRWLVTSDVQGFVNSSLINYGWCVKDATEDSGSGNNIGQYNSTEANNATDETQAPVLLVDYGLAATPTPGPSPTSSPTPSPTPTATPGATNLTVAAATGSYGRTVNLSATLTSGSGVNGKTISFTLNGNGVGSAVTNGSGVATLNNVSLYVPPKINAGSYPSGVAATFGGDTDYAAASGSNSLTVTQATLTITAVTNTKPYDGNASAEAVPTVSGLQGTDTVTRLREAYRNKQVGTGKTLSVAAYVVNDGNSGNNYNVSTVPNNTGVITAVTLTITAVTNSKPYDANTSAAATPTVSGLRGTDTVTGLSETYDNKNVGTGKTLSVASYTVNDGNGGNNYNVSTVPDNTGVITAVTLTITAITNSKPYDANTSAAAMPTVSGLQGTDTVTGLSETYDNKNVGAGKTLSVAAAYTVNDGNSGNNYSVNTVDDNTGVITLVTLTITAASNTKPYDANTSAAATPTVSGLQGTDTMTELSETYDNKNVGTGKTLSVASYTVNDGNGGNNYNVSTVPDNTGVITAVTLTITAITNSKPYDGNTSAAATPTVSGLQGNDTVTGLSETYDTNNVGTGKTLSVAADYTVNDGNSGNNYIVNIVPNNTGVITADSYINPMPLYAQHNAAFPFNGSNYCAPTSTAMMIQGQLDKPGVSVTVGSWTWNTFVGTPYTTKVLGEAATMLTDEHNWTNGYDVWLGFQNPLQDVRNSDGTLSVYEQDPNYPAQRTLSGYKEKLREGYAVGLLIDYLREKRVYDGFPSCQLVRYEYHKSGGHFVAVRGYDGNSFFINNPWHPSYDEREFGVMPQTKNGLPVQVYLENNYLVPSAMNVNYIGPVDSNNNPTTCGTSDVSCECDLALGISRAPVYASIPMDMLYLAH